MERLAPSLRLWFPALQYEPVYFANLSEKLRYARASYSMNHKKRGDGLEDGIQKCTLASPTLVLSDCSMGTAGLKHLPLTAESKFSLSSLFR